MYDVCGERERVELGGQVMAVRGCRQGTIRANGRILAVMDQRGGVFRQGYDGLCGLRTRDRRSEWVADLCLLRLASVCGERVPMWRVYKWVGWREKEREIRVMRAHALVQV